MTAIDFRPEQLRAAREAARLLGGAFRARCEQLGLSARAVADATGTPYTTVLSFGRGERYNAKLGTVVKLFTYVGLSLVVETPDPPAP